MKRTFIFPYMVGSRSVRDLAVALEGKILHTQKKSNYVHKPERLLINWGHSGNGLADHVGKGPILNPPAAVNFCADKLRFFNRMSEQGVMIPDFTTDQNQAAGWVDDGNLVIGRTELRSHSGEGMLFSDEDNEYFYEDSKVFVKYIKKISEYRVHIVRGEIIDIQQKKLRKEDDRGVAIDKAQINFRIRSHQNGFVFARNEVEVPDSVKHESLRAFEACGGLDFGAFDVIFNKHHNQAYVLECNTAPGLVGTTLENYTKAFNKIAVEEAA